MAPSGTTGTASRGGGGSPASLRIFPDEAAAGRALAEVIAAGIANAATEGRPYILGCPTGRTPRPTYRALVRLAVRRHLDLGHVILAMMDEYAVPTPAGPADVPHQAHYSCHRFAVHELVAPLNAAAAAPIGPDHVWFPDPAAPEAYDARLAAAGGIDLFILASGASDGHVAFNGPGSEAGSRSRLVTLPESTKRDNLATFPQFSDITEVPPLGVTVGIATIRELTHRAVMVVTGAQKREAFRRLTQATGYDPTWPATIIAECPRPAIYADAAAAGKEPTA
jgi:glucosamine-6-phosphate deaminase